MSPAKVLVIRDEIDKARFGRTVPLMPSAQAALSRICPDAGLVFGQHDYRPQLMKACIAAGMMEERAKTVSPYDFRHSRLTFLAERAPNLPGLQFVAGHTHASTSSKYIGPNARAAEEVYALISKNGPRDHPQR